MLTSDTLALEIFDGWKGVGSWAQKTCTRIDFQSDVYMLIAGLWKSGRTGECELESMK